MSAQLSAAKAVKEKRGAGVDTGKESIRLHSFYRGKMETTLKCRMGGWEDFSIWYTPGVAEPCRAIQSDPEKAYEYTSKWNTIAVVSDGTRVLGLGDIGPKAGLPVMEGKCLLFKYLGGVDAVPITLDTKDPEAIVETVRLIQPAFGGINLEDISNPKCFRILDTLRQRAEIPVWHDDQQGTATVVLAGLLNALRIVGKDLGQISITFVGCGASGVAVSRLLFGAGVRPGRCRVVDSRGLLHKGRADIERLREEYPDKWRLCQVTNEEGRTGNISRALEGADVCIALSRSDPTTLPPEGVSGMEKDAIVFALANPVPEIWPSEARAAGARIVATGRSDFPNQINNSLGFPAIFRGALDVRARTITDGMCVAAAEALAKRATESGLHEEKIVPTMLDSEAFLREAVAVGLKAQEEGVAQLSVTSDALRENAFRLIGRSRKMTEFLMEEGLIEKVPGS